MRRYMLLIPLLIMALAALACDSYIPDAPKVVQVEADPQTPGKAFARVAGEVSYSQISAAYETTDYGQSWHKTDHTFSSAGDTAFSFYGENLYDSRTGARVWSFPRATFRFFFAPDSEEDSYFQFAPMKGCSAVSEADPSIVYVCMGTEGVLVGPNPAAPVHAPGCFPARALTLSRRCA